VAAKRKPSKRRVRREKKTTKKLVWETTRGADRKEILG